MKKTIILISLSFALLLSGCDQALGHSKSRPKEDGDIVNVPDHGATLPLLAAGLLGVAMYARRRKS